MQEFAVSIVPSTVPRAGEVRVTGKGLPIRVIRGSDFRIQVEFRSGSGPWAARSGDIPVAVGEAPEALAP